MGGKRRFRRKGERPTISQERKEAILTLERLAKKIRRHQEPAFVIVVANPADTKDGTVGVYRWANWTPQDQGQAVFMATRKLIEDILADQDRGEKPEA